MDTTKQFADVSRRIRVDSGFTEEIPLAESGTESLFQSSPEHVFGEEDDFTQRTRNVSTNSSQGRFRVFFEEGNISGAQRIMLEDTSAETPRRYQVFVPEERIDTEERFTREDMNNQQGIQPQINGGGGAEGTQETSRATTRDINDNNETKWSRKGPVPTDKDIQETQKHATRNSNNIHGKDEGHNYIQHSCQQFESMNSKHGKTNEENSSKKSERAKSGEENGHKNERGDGPAAWVGTTEQETYFKARSKQASETKSDQKKVTDTQTSSQVSEDSSIESEGSTKPLLEYEASSGKLSEGYVDNCTYSHETRQEVSARSTSDTFDQKNMKDGATSSEVSKDATRGHSKYSLPGRKLLLGASIVLFLILAALATTLLILLPVKPPELLRSMPPKCCEGAHLQKISTAHGSIECKGNKLKLSCNSNYTSTQEEVWQDCSELETSDEAWQCKPLVCSTPPQSLSYGKIMCNDENFTVGSSCKIDCSFGLARTEDSLITCQQDRSWSPLPSCLPPPCSKPDQIRGNVTCTEGGQYCILRCPDGGLSQISECGVDGRWDKNFEEPRCSKGCGFESFQHGFLSCGSQEKNKLYQALGVPQSTTCTKVCHTGFHIFQGSQTVKCSTSGHWSSSFGNCERTVLVVAGGEEKNKNAVQTVEVFDSKKSLPSLPKPSSWGSLGFVGGELLFCGGQIQLIFHNECWYLDRQSNTWKLKTSLLR